MDITVDGRVAMPTYNDKGEIQDWCWYDIFWDVEKKRFFAPRWWVRHLTEQSEDWELPWFIQSRIYWLDDYLAWIKTPRGVTLKHIKPYKKKYILRSTYDVEDFDADGIGDIMYTEYDYREFHSLENMLHHLKKDVRYENEMKPKLDTVEEFSQEFGFEVYERLY